ncbi:haloacid dehalogenase type II [Cocleimonas flava]|uniref:(S)-2-haloacid dehalogenase n=1 Tax=Cocleimonas flava TaxID=634765 RepID=A0A4R1EWV2_9GAMM|nr:haloacid dehalogenase type II [Cocleimonas flava]TCJ84462.1 2-haloacid dehalogenase [Cocleimonas flava]
MPASSQKSIAFDVYGTLINTHGVVSKLEEIVGGIEGVSAQGFSNTWREKQLEYSFRRGLMQEYQNFAVCTAQALEYTCIFYGLNLPESDKQALLESYKTLPAFDDVTDGLTAMKDSGHKLYAFSNGSAEAVEMLLVTAGIRDFFDGVVSVDDLKTFKPNPSVYHHFMKQSESTTDNAWLVSSNPFDVIGAVNIGMSAAWVKRTEQAIFDPWGIDPTIVIQSLTELDGKLDE